MKRCRSCGTVWQTDANQCPYCGSKNIDFQYTPSPLEDEYRAKVRQCLEANTATLIKELRNLIHKEWDEETYLIDFEVHSHGYPGYENHDFTFPIRWYAMDEENGQLDDGGDLLGNGVVIPKELYWDAVYQAFDKNDAAFRVLVTWFADCWDQANGDECEYPAYISHHDSGIFFDLKTKRWVPNNMEWPE